MEYIKQNVCDRETHMVCCERRVNFFKDMYKITQNILYKDMEDVLELANIHSHRIYQIKCDRAFSE